MTNVLTYCDTSAFMRRAEGLNANCSPRNKLIAPVIEGILDDPNRSLACSELTLVEFHDTLTKDWRDSNLPSYDAAWWERAQADVLDRIASERIAVLPTPPRALEQVMALVTISTRDHGKPLRAWDALHMHVAAKWANAEGRQVDLVTSDEDFEIVGVVAGLTRFLTVSNLDVLAHTGFGADAP